MNSKEIVRHIRATLEKDTRINLHRYPITIATQNGDLILSGDVESVSAKKLDPSGGGRGSWCSSESSTG